MSKKILISLSVIGAVAALAIGGTIAYFSDTETSTGNTFTAGSIDLKIDDHCYYNGLECKLNPGNEKYQWYNPQTQQYDGDCSCTWGLKDLTDNDLFFNFSDLKPGDNGEDTVSLHVYNNDAWACVTFKNLLNKDNTCTEPEKADDPHQDGNCGITNPGEPAGELAQNLYFVFWADDGDNVYEPPTEVILMQGKASDLLPGPKIYPIADKTFSIAGSPGTPLTGSHDYYIGKAWCFGTMTIGTDGTITCNGQPVNNASQSDSLTGSIEFYAVQARNNPNFVCGQ